MYVCDFPQGRYGNAIFRYLASSLFCIIYNAERTYDINSCDTVVSDIDFIEWSNQILQNNIPQLDTTKSYLFRGYYQHDKIFLKYRDLLINYINMHPGDVLITDGYKPGATGIYHYPVAEYLSRELVVSNDTPTQYDIVVHLRLEDFVFVNQVIHPKCISDILYKIVAIPELGTITGIGSFSGETTQEFRRMKENISNNPICFVVAKPSTTFEHKYIDYFANRFNIICESNTPTQDYHIIKNAKTLVCSRSTICWAAAFVSNTLETVYFPNYIATNHIHETFKTPIPNTIPYDVILTTENEINYYLDNISI